jgi:hypothetical protein
VASRERKRTGRRKRKQRAGARRAEIAERRARMAERSEQRNREARERLEPLAEGERPGAVTVGAVAAGLVALAFWVSTALAIFTDLEVNGDKPSIVYLIAVGVLMSAMSWGLWNARYWAVLGLQAFLVLIMISAALGLVQAATILQALGTTLILVLAGTLFYFMIKAMARIQMPERLPRE